MFKHNNALKDAQLRPLWHDPEFMPEPEPSLGQDKKCELLIAGQPARIIPAPTFGRLGLIESAYLLI